MSDPKVLTDALVEAGIIKQDTHSPGLGITRNLSTYNNGKTADQIITDWRVAGKVLESMVSFDVDAADEWTISVWLSGAFSGPSSTARNESLPLAIIEAWYAAQG